MKLNKQSLLLPLCIITVGLIGCSTSSSSTSSDTSVPDYTYITYEYNETDITSQNVSVTIEPGENIFIEATVTGDEDVYVIWSYSLGGGYSGNFPETTTSSFSLSPNSGTIVVSGEPNKTLTINGESYISGETQLTIQVEETD